MDLTYCIVLKARLAPMDFASSLENFRKLTCRQIDLLMRRRNYNSDVLYRLLPEYTARRGKGIRPALCLAACAASNGNITDALNSAVAVELFHNAFLIKDDIEDDSEYRRRDETIKARYGTSVALNVGDAMSVLAMKALLRNVQKIGVHKALVVFQEIQRMAERTVEGQAMELEWVRQNEWDILDKDYYLMCQGKTAWYTAATPCRVGTIIGSSDISHSRLSVLTRFGLNLGVAFQIQDDILNLIGNEVEYGKEINGDLVEGKRTLILIRTFRAATGAERTTIAQITARTRNQKTKEDIRFLRRLIKKYDSIRVCAGVSKRFAKKARDTLKAECAWMVNQHAKDFLTHMADYVVNRQI